MVNATVDNAPVSIILGANESTTVPSNETWRVSLHLANKTDTRMEIDDSGVFRGESGVASSQGNYLDVTLTGGQTITEAFGDSESTIFITGFVVNS